VNSIISRKIYNGVIIYYFRGIRMKIRVKFLANVGIFMEIKEINLELNQINVTIRDIIEEITKITGKDLKGKVMNEMGESTGRVRIIVNGKDIVSLQRFNTPILEKDEISMFPALGAG
jgi:molybdopterin converting factor small subunit